MSDTETPKATRKPKATRPNAVVTEPEQPNGNAAETEPKAATETAPEAVETEPKVEEVTPAPEPKETPPEPVQQTAPVSAAQDLPEIWSNDSRSRIGILRADPINGTRVEMVRAGAQVHLTTAERKLNNEKITKVANNPFKNGALSPIQIVETADDLKDILDSPNLISRSEIDSLLSDHVDKMEARIAKIDSVVTLKRILDVAESEGHAVRRLNILRDRVIELGPQSAPGEPTFSGTREKFYPPELGGSSPAAGAREAVTG